MTSATPQSPVQTALAQPSGRAGSSDRRAHPPVRDVLALFCFDWDEIGYQRLANRYRLHRAGFDLFSFPSNLRLAAFDIEHFVSRLTVRYADSRIAGVTSANEQFGALAAAMLAEQLDLPGTSPESIIRCQHKLGMRQLMSRVAPEANISYFPLDCEYGGRLPENLSFPLFVKPIKAAFSVLARRVENRAELERLLRFSRLEAWIIRRLVAPFNALAQRRIGFAVDAHHMVCETPIVAPQFNLDGYVFDGQTRMIGVVDAHMYPGTQAFQRFTYPSKLPAAVQARALDVARRFLKAAQFSHGIFNMEFFYDAGTDELKVIEFNPRLASQIADLYLRVDGTDVHAMNLALACGDDPSAVPRQAPLGAAAASFVFRSFDTGAPRAPEEARQRRLMATEPYAIFLDFAKGRRARARDLKWLGSHRYGVLHLHGDDEADLRARFERACDTLGWPPGP
jgi:biotin carboxylase